MLEIKDLSVRYGKQAPTIEHFNLNMKKGEIIKVACGGEGRKLIFDDVVVRVNKDAVTTMHIDTDESQAAGNPKVGEIVR